MAIFPGLLRWAGTRKVKSNLDLLKQKTVSGSGISWAICKSAPRSIQITTLAPNHSVFLQAGRPSCHPANSIKALMAISYLLIKTSNKWPFSRTAQRKQLYNRQHCCSHSLLLFILLGLSQGSVLAPTFYTLNKLFYSDNYCILRTLA